MKAAPTPVTRLFKVAAAIFFIYTSVGCDVDSSNNTPPVPTTGLVMYAEANLHESEETAQIAAAVYRDGVPVGLIGGDVFEARTTTQRVLLKDSGSYDGSYAAPLVIDVVQDVFLNVVHEPIEARDDRWYPVDLLNIDPGPGELVGCEWLSEGESWDPFKALQVIMPAITLGFLTSVLAYLVLLVTVDSER